MPDGADLHDRRRLVAIGQALLVTFLWSTSWVLIKVGLDDLELTPLAFAGLRYTLAALILLPLALPRLRRAAPWRAERSLLGRAALLGVLLYAVTQGAQFAALSHLPAVTVGLVISATPAVVALISAAGRHERVGPIRAAGVAVLLAGALLYFGPVAPRQTALVGLVIAAVCLVANSVSSVLGRSIARDAVDRLGGSIGLTTVSMLVGGTLLLAVGIVTEGIPSLPPQALVIVAWLAVVNTALAFTLWNHTLRVLTAVESSVLNNTMLVQIAVLAWLFLGETLDVRQLIGLALAVAGILIVQLASARRPRPVPATGTPV